MIRDTKVSRKCRKCNLQTDREGGGKLFCCCFSSPSPSFYLRCRVWMCRVNNFGSSGDRALEFPIEINRRLPAVYLREPARRRVLTGHGARSSLTVHSTRGSWAIEVWSTQSMVVRAGADVMSADNKDKPKEFDSFTPSGPSVPIECFSLEFSSSVLLTSTESSPWWPSLKDSRSALVSALSTFFFCLFFFFFFFFFFF